LEEMLGMMENKRIGGRRLEKMLGMMENTRMGGGDWTRCWE
jgi:hypothetical protein